MAARLEWLAPLMSHAYETEAAEVERLVGAHGCRLVVSHPVSRPEQPAFHIMTSKEKKLALLIVRGTETLGDWMTDAKALPVKIGAATGQVCCSDCVERVGPTV